MGKRLELIGQYFGRLLVIADNGTNKYGYSLWKCKCFCGKNIIVLGHSLKSGNTKSCGCLRKETTKKQAMTHGKYSTIEYKSWNSMKDRCLNKNCPTYKHYGGRGITVCKHWLKFENFLEDMGKRPNLEYSIERVNNEKGYSPENCVWVTQTTQNRNKRMRKDNTTGYIGTCWDKSRKKYIAHIGVDNKLINLGRFAYLSDAIIARKAAEVKYWGETSNG